MVKTNKKICNFKPTAHSCISSVSDDLFVIEAFLDGRHRKCLQKMNIEGCCVVFNNERIVPYIENHSKKDVIVNPRVDQTLDFSLN